MRKAIKPAAFLHLLLLCLKPVLNNCSSPSTKLDMAHISRPVEFFLIFPIEVNIILEEKRSNRFWEQRWNILGAKMKHFGGKDQPFWEQRSMSFLWKLLMFHASSAGCQGACLEIQWKIHTVSTLTPQATQSKTKCFNVFLTNQFLFLCLNVASVC